MCVVSLSSNVSLFVICLIACVARVPVRGERNSGRAKGRAKVFRIQAVRKMRREQKSERSGVGREKKGILLFSPPPRPSSFLLSPHFSRGPNNGNACYTGYLFEGIIRNLYSQTAENRMVFMHCHNAIRGFEIS